MPPSLVAYRFGRLVQSTTETELRSAKPRFAELTLEPHNDTLVDRLQVVDYEVEEQIVSYVLIFQFPETFFESVDEIRDFEKKLTSSLPKTCHVDGFDSGSGTTNFFVFTQFPLAAFNTFRKYLGTNLVEKNLRASFREETGEVYTNLWPYRDNRPFDLIYPHGIDPFSPKSKRSIPKRSPPGASKFETPALEEWP